MTEEEVIENSTSEEDTSPKVTEEEMITVMDEKRRLDLCLQPPEATGSAEQGENLP